MSLLLILLGLGLATGGKPTTGRPVGAAQAPAASSFESAKQELAPVQRITVAPMAPVETVVTTQQGASTFEAVKQVPLPEVSITLTRQGTSTFEQVLVPISTATLLQVQAGVTGIDRSALIATANRLSQTISDLSGLIADNQSVINPLIAELNSIPVGTRINYRQKLEDGIAFYQSRLSELQSQLESTRVSLLKVQAQLR